jgi:hypothetical protein
MIPRTIPLAKPSPEDHPDDWPTPREPRPTPQANRHTVESLRAFAKLLISYDAMRSSSR